MLRNYFKIAWRNITRNKVYSFINIWGLTVGLACSLLIFLYVFDELSFDKFHTDYEDIYRLESKFEINSSFSASLSYPSGLAPTLKDEVPAVKHAVRLERNSKALITKGDEKIYEERFYYSDPSFFEVFAFDLLQGDKSTALENPHSVILTQELAEKYFPDENPVGKNFNIDNEDFLVTGVLDKIPHNTHLQFNMLASFSTIEKEETRWKPFPYYDLYVELEKDASLEELEANILEILKRNMNEDGQKYSDVVSRPLADLYLKAMSHVYDDYLRGNIKFVRIFLTIGLLILGIACINFMNLTTARASMRAKEIGIRKSSGALRSQITLQFLSESILITFLATLLSIVLVELLLPFFNQITGKELELNLISNLSTLIGILTVCSFTGFLAGIYPALYLSGFKPVSVLKGQFSSGKSAALFRKGLVVVQFVITVGLIVCTLIINGQLNYLQERGLGINAEALVSIPVKKSSDYPAFKGELLKNPDVANVTTGSLLLGGIRFETYTEEDEVEYKPKGNTLQVYETDFDFVETLELEVLAGRNFDADISTDASANALLNATAIEAYGWSTPEEALGKELEFIGKTYTVVGVIQDFHAYSPASKILPTVITITDDGVDQILARLQTQDLGKTLESLKAAWGQFNPFIPFEINFMDDELNAEYRNIRNLQILFGAFTFLTIFIACLGLLGLATFSAEQRRKEIGIRKILGASVQRILVLVSKDFLLLVGIGFAIAVPVAWYFMNKWITNYPYRIEIEPYFFLVAGGIALLLSLATVSFQAMKAATSNPVESLRNE